MFSALPLAVDMGAGPQDDILATQANQLGNPEPCLDREQEHRPIAAPNPGGKIRDRQQSVDLVPIEKFDGPTFVTFGGHGEYSLAEQRVGGLLESHVLKEGVNCGQPDVPSASAILPATLKIIEEITNERDVQITELLTALCPAVLLQNAGAGGRNRDIPLWYEDWLHVAETGGL